MNTEGMKVCTTCYEYSPYDAKWCIICGSAFPSYTDGTQRLGDIVLGDKIAGDVVYGNKIEYGHVSKVAGLYFEDNNYRLLVASGIPLNTSPGRLRITATQYWGFLARKELSFDLNTGEVILYGYPVDIDWSR